MKLEMCTHCEHPLLSSYTICPRCGIANRVSWRVKWLWRATSALGLGGVAFAALI